MLKSQYLELDLKDTVVKAQCVGDALGIQANASPTSGLRPSRHFPAGTNRVTETNCVVYD